MSELVEIRLYGHLRRFGKIYRLAVKSPAEAVRALCAVVPGLRKHLAQHSDPGYRIIVGKTPIAEEKELRYPSGLRRIGIVPVVAGAAGGGKIIGGIALIALSFVPGVNVAVWAGASTTWASIAFNIGVSLVLGGVSQMIAGTPKAPTPSERPNNQPSYTFDGPVNVTAQGQCVPLCYGRMRVGSVVISSGLSVAQLA